MHKPRLVCEIEYGGSTHYDALLGTFLAPFVLSIVVLIRHDGVRADERGFQLDRALQDAWRRDGFRRHRRQPGDAELVGFISVAAQRLARRNGIGSGCCAGKAIDAIRLILRRKIDDALARSDDVLSSLRYRLETQHCAPTEPEHR